jgi:N-sulfoglucosamine sulfohydrolase
VYSRKPNILFITSHDLGRHLNCYGLHEVNSPNLDRFAGEGIRFANAFCAAPQCSPSRASLFTGRWPHSNGVMGLTHGYFGWDLHDDEKHLAQILSEAGWYTASLGGNHESRRQDRLGFDRILHDEGRDCFDRTAIARDFLCEGRPKDRPFYLQIGYSEVHREVYGFSAEPDEQKGIYVPPYLVEEFTSLQEFTHFQGAVRKLDTAFGQLFAVLEEEGIADDTLVIFTADHGIPFPRAKCSLYDPGLEVALLMRWKYSNWETGMVVNSMASNVDVVPTLLDLLELTGPYNLQGKSFAPLLVDEPSSPRQEIFGEMTYHDYCDPRRCIRTETHKLIVNFTAAPFFMDPTQQWRPQTITRHPPNPAYAYHEPVELYDLRVDRLETNNLAASSEHSDIRRDLLRRLHEWMQITQDPLLHGIPTSPIHRSAMQALAEYQLPGLE